MVGGRRGRGRGGGGCGGRCRGGGGRVRGRSLRGRRLGGRAGRRRSRPRRRCRRRWPPGPAGATAARPRRTAGRARLGPTGRAHDDRVGRGGRARIGPTQPHRAPSTGAARHDPGRRRRRTPDCAGARRPHRPPPRPPAAQGAGRPRPGHRRGAGALRGLGRPARRAGPHRRGGLGQAPVPDLGGGRGRPRPPRAVREVAAPGLAATAHAGCGPAAPGRARAVVGPGRGHGLRAAHPGRAGRHRRPPGPRPAPERCRPGALPRPAHAAAGPRSGRSCSTRPRWPASATSTGPRSCSSRASTPSAPARDLRPHEREGLWTETVHQLRLGLRRGKIITRRADEVDGPVSRLPRAEAHYVYHRSTCRICGGPLRRIELAARRIDLCPHCQPRRPRRDHTPTRPARALTRRPPRTGQGSRRPGDEIADHFGVVRLVRVGRPATDRDHSVGAR